MKTKYNVCSSTWRNDSLSRIVISNIKLSDSSIGLAIEVIVHDRDPEQGLHVWVDADTIAIAADRDTLFATSFTRDTSGIYKGNNFFINYSFIIPLNKLQMDFLKSKEITSIGLSYTLFKGYLSIPIRCRKTFKFIVK